MSLLEPREYYRPMQYDWAFEAYERQLKQVWTPEEVNLSEDLSDFNNKLSEEERNLVRQLLRFFVAVEVDIAGGYTNWFLPALKPPEIRMALSSFAFIEAVHQHSYSLLLDTVGMPESEYSAFLEYQEMADKHEHLYQISTETRGDLARSIAAYSAFTEGVVLYSSFVVLFNFQRHQKLTGTGQIITFGQRDEELHVETGIKIFRQLIKENPELWTDDLKRSIYQEARDTVTLEDRFIDLMFEMGGVEGLTAEEVKQYIRYLTDRRLLSLGMKPEFGVKDNPIPWVSWFISLDEQANFFETRNTEYSKGGLSGEWGSIWAG